MHIFSGLAILLALAACTTQPTARPDRPTGSSDIHVVRLANATAEDLARELRATFRARITETTAATGTAPAGPIIITAHAESN